MQCFNQPIGICVLILNFSNQPVNIFSKLTPNKKYNDLSTNVGFSSYV